MAQSSSVLNKVQRQSLPGADTDPLTIYDARQMQGNIADVVDKLVQFVTQFNTTQAATNAGYQLLSLKDAANGYAGLDANTRLKAAEWPWHFGWVNFGDNAGTITVNESSGTDVATVGFRTGTAAGDYALTIPVVLGSAFWPMSGVATDTAGGNNLIVSQNTTNFLHSSTVLNFTTFSRAAGTNTRPTECLLFWAGKK